MMKKQSPLTKASDPVMDAANGKHAPRERLTKYRKLWILISAGLLALAVALVGMILALKSRPPPLYAGVSSMPAAESELIADQTAEEPSLESAPAATPDESVPLSEPQASSAAPISSASSTQSVQASSLPPAVSSKGPALPSFPFARQRASGHDSCGCAGGYRCPCRQIAVRFLLLRRRMDLYQRPRPGEQNHSHAAGRLRQADALRLYFLRNAGRGSGLSLLCSIKVHRGTAMDAMRH